MKNPITHLKHLWKDPINSIAEADARKKEIMPWLIGSIALAVVPSLVMSLVDLAFLSVFSMVGVVGIMVFGFMLFVIGKAKSRFTVLTCDECNTLAEIKTPEAFTEFITYSIAKNEASYDGISHPSSNNGIVPKIEAKGSAFAVVEIALKCPNCGKVRNLEYRITPFKCTAAEDKVPVRDVEAVKARLEAAAREAVAAYNDPEKREKIPYSIHSVHNPNYEDRTKLQAGNNRNAYPVYGGVKINYHKEVDEMVEQYFLQNQLDGTLVDPSKSKK